MAASGIGGWAFNSSSSDVVYEVRVHEDRSLTCNCPAWRFVKAGQPRSCKHLKQVTEAMITAKLAEVASGVSAPVAARPAAPSTLPTPNYGRVAAAANAEIKRARADLGLDPPRKKGRLGHVERDKDT